MEQVIIIIRQIGALALLILLGFFARKKGILPENGGRILSKLIVNVTLPILTLLSLTKYRFDKSIWLDGLGIVLFGVCIHLVLFAMGTILSKRLGLKEKRRNVYRAQLMIANTVFLAFPLMKSLFGDTGLVYALIYYLVSSTFIWTLGVYLFNKHQVTKKGDIIKSLMNPCTVSFMIGILLILVDFDSVAGSNPFLKEIYDYVYTTFSPVGDMTMPLSMLFIGLTMANISYTRFVGIIRDRSIWALVGTKLFIMPCLVMGALYLSPIQISTMATTVILLEAAMPASSITVAIASEYGADYEYALEIVIITTMISIITIPVVVLGFNHFF